MGEPITTITVGAVGAYLAKDGVAKLLGPTAAYLGDELQKFVQRRHENVKRIFDNGVKKSADDLDEEGCVPPRVLRDVISDGSYREEEISVEYFGGVLASSRSELGRDDRAATFTSLLSRLSTYQIRCHYILYGCLREKFLGSNLNLPDMQQRNQARTAINFIDFVTALEISAKEAGESLGILEHATFGLYREDLIGNFKYAGLEYFVRGKEEVPFKVVEFVPTVLGAELFLRAHGVKARSSTDIFKSDSIENFESQIIKPDQQIRCHRFTDLDRKSAI